MEKYLPSAFLMCIEIIYAENFSLNYMLNVYCISPRGTFILQHSKTIFVWNVVFGFIFYKLSIDILRNTQFCAISVFLNLIHSLTLLVSPKSCRLFLEYKLAGVFACLSLQQAMLFLESLYYTRLIMSAQLLFLHGCQDCICQLLPVVCVEYLQVCFLCCTTRTVAPRLQWNIVLSVRFESLSAAESSSMCLQSDMVSTCGDFTLRSGVLKATSCLLQFAQHTLSTGFVS